MRSATHGAIILALAVLWSHYPSVKPKLIMTSFARGTDAQKTAKLEDEAKEATTRLAEDVDLFSEGQGNAQWIRIKLLSKYCVEVLNDF